MANRSELAEYLGIDLDEETFVQVETLARESNVTPFEMGVILLREAIGLHEAQSLPEQASR